MERNVSLDWLRGIAIIFVVLIHVCCKYSMQGTPLSIRWLTCLGAEAIVRVGLTSFFVLSGFLLIREFRGSQDFLRFYRKRVWRMFPLFIFWSFVYYVCSTRSFDVIDYLRKVLAGPTEPHFWFVYSLFGIYLGMPFVANVIVNAKTRDLISFCAGSFLAFTMAPVVNLLGVSQSFLGIFPISVWAVYFIAGHLARRLCDNLEVASYKNCLVAYSLATILIFFISFFTSNGSQPIFKIPDPEPYSQNIAMPIATLCFFIVIRRYCVFPLPPLIKFISDRSYGIYLSHILFYNYYNTHLTLSPWYLDLVCMFIFTMACSLACEWIFSKVKFLDRLNSIIIAAKQYGPRKSSMP